MPHKLSLLHFSWFVHVQAHLIAEVHLLYLQDARIAAAAGRLRHCRAFRQ